MTLFQGVWEEGGPAAGLAVSPASRGIHSQAAALADKTVLLVSRPGHVREALLGLLKTLPFLKNITTAESGLLALRFTGEQQPHLVLVAGGLPEAEGPELVRQMKQRWPATPCLVMAENARQYELAKQAGASCVLRARTPLGQMLSTITAMVNLP